MDLGKLGLGEEMADPFIVHDSNYIAQDMSTFANRSMPSYPVTILEIFDVARSTYGNATLMDNAIHSQAASIVDQEMTGSIQLDGYDDAMQEKSPDWINGLLNTPALSVICKSGSEALSRGNSLFSPTCTVLFID